MNTVKNHVESIPSMQLGDIYKNDKNQLYIISYERNKGPFVAIGLHNGEPILNYEKEFNNLIYVGSNLLVIVKPNQN